MTEKSSEAMANKLTNIFRNKQVGVMFRSEKNKQNNIGKDYIKLVIDDRNSVTIIPRLEGGWRIEGSIPNHQDIYTSINSDKELLTFLEEELSI